MYERSYLASSSPCSLYKSQGCLAPPNKRIPSLLTDIHLPSFDLNLHTNTSKREINSDLYTITIMSSENVFLIWGGEGWVAGHLKTLLESQGKQALPAAAIDSHKLTSVQERRSSQLPSACKTEKLSLPRSRNTSQPTSSTLRGQLAVLTSIGVRTTRRRPSETTLSVPSTWLMLPTRRESTLLFLQLAASTPTMRLTQLAAQGTRRPTRPISLDLSIPRLRHTLRRSVQHIPDEI